MPGLACGGSSGRDACRAEEHPPVGTTLCPKPAHGPSAGVATLPHLGEEPFFVRAPRACAAGRGRQAPASAPAHRGPVPPVPCPRRPSPLGARRRPAGPRSHRPPHRHPRPRRSEEHTSELQSLMRISYAVFCLNKKNTSTTENETVHNDTHIN